MASSTAQRLKDASDAGLLPSVLILGGSTSISGHKFCASSFQDGSAALMVDGRIVDHSVEPVSYSVIEAWAHAGQILTTLSQEEIASRVRTSHPGCQKASISGVIWNSNGTYSGIDWRN